MGRPDRSAIFKDGADLERSRDDQRIVVGEEK